MRITRSGILIVLALLAPTASISHAIENVEVDHLWLGDNGQKYDFKVWGPEGPGVIGSAGKIDHLSFHDLTIETHHLCGLNTDSQTDGFSIYNVTVRSSANHGFYLAGNNKVLWYENRGPSRH